MLGVVIALMFAYRYVELSNKFSKSGVVGALIELNLAGVGKLTKVKIGIVSVNLLVLLGLGVYGLTRW